MANIYLLSVAVVLLICLVLGERKGSRGLILGFKTPLSVLFVVAAVIQPHPLPSYYHLVLVGLILGLVGDVCLALPGNRAFMAGLVSFLVGHVLYVVAFAGLTSPMDWVNLGNVLILAVSLYVLWWLLPHVGKMLVPVVLYIVVISAMLAAGWAAFRHTDVSWAAATTILIGAVLFYVSDVFVARDRFVKQEFLNRLVGLPLYYCAQFLIAFSVGLVG